MPTFKYLAKEPDGKSITGLLESKSQASAIEQLRAKQLIIISVEQARAGGLKTRAKGKRVKLDDLVIFSRQLATMVDSGIPLVQALDILYEQMENRQFRDVIGKARQDIEAGSSLSEAFAKHPRIFSALYVSMVKAGETSGLLDDILDRLAGYLEKSNALQRKVRSAMVYPAVVISMALLITMLLVLKVVPTFKGIFDTLGGQLPLPTRVLIGISDFLRHYFFIWFGGVVLGVGGLMRFVRTEQGKGLYDRFILKAPVIGSLVQKVSIAKFARTLATLVKSGVPIIGSLDIVAKTSGNRVVEKALVEVRTYIREGESIAEPLSRCPVFPPMVVRMIGVGEQTGELEKMLTKIADFYEEQVDASVAGLTSILEPLIIAFLGVVIGGIVLAMFMPIFKLTTIVGGQ
ncbi:MAG: type II secretion system inner membrane protein GspF [Candidatus Omnitrophica bacterium]|nr:type II secretion system inner membrane protein GspF [Candidatus Omnitrophota bacterium]